MSLDRVVEFACREGEIRHLRLILAMDGVHDYAYTDPCGIAAAYGNVTVLAMLREHGIPWGATLSRAIEHEQFHVVRWVLKRGTGTRAPTDLQSTSRRPALVFRRAALQSF